MRKIEASRATATLSEYVGSVQIEPIIVTISGKPKAALVPIEDVDMETLSLGTNPDFLAIIEKSRARQKVEDGISSQEMRRRLNVEFVKIKS